MTRSYSASVSPWRCSIVAGARVIGRGSAARSTHRLVATELEDDGADGRGGGPQEEQQLSDAGTAEREPIERDAEADEDDHQGRKSQLRNGRHAGGEEDARRDANEDDEQDQLDRIQESVEQADEHAERRDRRPGSNEPGGHGDRHRQRQVDRRRITPLSLGPRAWSRSGD